MVCLLVALHHSIIRGPLLWIPELDSHLKSMSYRHSSLTRYDDMLNANVLLTIKIP